jgi:hypothetical protein
LTIEWFLQKEEWKRPELTNRMEKKGKGIEVKRGFSIWMSNRSPGVLCSPTDARCIEIVQNELYKFPRITLFHLFQSLGDTRIHQATASITGFGPEINDPIGRADHIRVVLDD